MQTILSMRHCASLLGRTLPPDRQNYTGTPQCRLVSCRYLHSTYTVCTSYNDNDYNSRDGRSSFFTLRSQCSGVSNSSIRFPASAKEAEADMCGAQAPSPARTPTLSKESVGFKGSGQVRPSDPSRFRENARFTPGGKARESTQPMEGSWRRVAVRGGPHQSGASHRCSKSIGELRRPRNARQREHLWNCTANMVAALSGRGHARRASLPAPLPPPLHAQASSQLSVYSCDESVSPVPMRKTKFVRGSSLKQSCKSACATGGWSSGHFDGSNEGPSDGSFTPRGSQMSTHI